MIFKKEAKGLIAMGLFVFFLNQVEEQFAPPSEDPRRQRHEEQIEKMVATGKFERDARGNLQVVPQHIPGLYEMYLESGAELPTGVKHSRRFQLWKMKYERQNTARD